MTHAALSCRQPDYIVGGDGIPRLLVRKIGKMNTAHRSSIVPATDPIKLKKCLYNIAVRNSSTAAVKHGSRSSKPESDIAIRSRSGNKSSSSTSRNNSSTSSSSSSNNNSCSAHATSPQPALSVCSHSSSTTVLNNWRVSIASQTAARNYDAPWDQQRRVCANNNTSSIPGGSRNYNLICRATSTSSSRPSMTASSSIPLGSIRLNGVTSNNNHRTAMLLGNRQRRNVDAAAALNRNHDCAGNLMRQCRPSARTVTAPISDNNRLNYQRKYDRTVFGYNRLDQFVLPPLQI